MKKINSQDLYPISLDYWFVDPKPIPWARFNMALNKKFIPEIVDRLAVAFSSWFRHINNSILSYPILSNIHNTSYKIYIRIMQRKE